MSKIHLHGEQSSWKTICKLAECLYNQGYKKYSHITKWRGKKKKKQKKPKTLSWDLCYWEGTKTKRRLYRDRHLSRAMSGLSQRLNVPVLGSYAGETRYPWLLGELLDKKKAGEDKTSLMHMHGYGLPPERVERDPSLLQPPRCTPQSKVRKCIFPAQFMPQLGSRSSITSNWEKT